MLYQRRAIEYRLCTQAGFDLDEIRSLPDSEVYQFAVLHDEYEQIEAEQAEQQQPDI